MKQVAERGLREARAWFAAQRDGYDSWMLGRRARLKQPPLMSHVVRLTEGDVVNVLADVKHQDAKFDRSDPKVSGKGKRSDKDAFDAALKQPPLSSPSDDS
jgi:hypothetical protein